MVSSGLEHLAKALLRAILIVMLVRCSGSAQQAALAVDQAVQQALDKYPAVRSSLEQVYAAAEGINLARTAYLPSADFLGQVNRATHNNLAGTYNPQAPGSAVYPFSTPSPIFLVASTGLYNQNQLIFNVNSKVKQKIPLFASYVLSRAMSNTDGLGTFPANPYSMAGEYRPAALTDIRHRVSFSGSITTKWGLQFSPLLLSTPVNRSISPRVRTYTATRSSTAGPVSRQIRTSQV